MSNHVHPRVVIVPGNGCSDVREANWYAFAETKLGSRTDIISEVVLRDMPDPMMARESIWVPFLLEECGCDENTIIIGHSSGAEACMRLLESNKLLGCFLVCACHTDLGCESEAAAGYYNHPWEWESIKSNAGAFGIMQCHSSDDPFIPMHEAQFVADQLNSDFRKYKNRSHFFGMADIDDLLDVFIDKIKDLGGSRDGAVC